MTNDPIFESYLRKIEELQREVCDLKKRLTAAERHVRPGAEIVVTEHGGQDNAIEIAPRYSDRIRFRWINMRRMGYRAIVSPDDFIALVMGDVNGNSDDVSPDTLDYFRYLSRMGHEWGPLTIHTNEVPSKENGIEDRMWRLDGFKRAVYFSKVRGLDKIPIQVFPSTTDDELLPATEEQLERIRKDGIYAFHGDRVLPLKDVSIVL